MTAAGTHNGLTRAWGWRIPPRLALIAWLIASPLGYTQNSPGKSAAGTAPAEPDANRGLAIRVRRLENVSWNPGKRELRWVVSAGDLGSEGYEVTRTEAFVIHTDIGVMEAAREGRRFSQQEADEVERLLDLISQYAFESTIWWEHGGGEKLEPSTKTRAALMEPDTGKPVNTTPQRLRDRDDRAALAAPVPREPLNSAPVR